MASESGMNAGVEHDGFAFVLNNVARAADFVAAAEGDEGQFIRGVDGVVWWGGHGGVGPFGRHGGRGGRAVSAAAGELCAVGAG